MICWLLGLVSGCLGENGELAVAWRGRAAKMTEREKRDGCGKKWRKWRWEGRFVEVGSSGGWFEGEGVAKGKRPRSGRLFGEGELVFLFR